jgi:hypothetical protein
MREMRSLFPKICLVTWIAVSALCAGSAYAEVVDFVQVNLVSDISGLATITDSELVNPWGVSHSTTRPFWISNQGKSTTTLYAVTDKTNVSKVNINPPVGFVAIPTTASGPQGPTGQVNNSNTSSFPVKNGGDGGSAIFIFANLNGTISAWDGGLTAFIQVTTPEAVYTGLAINGTQTRLYAANSTGTGRVDVFDSSFNPVSLGDSAFVNPLRCPTGSFRSTCGKSAATFTWSMRPPGVPLTSAPRWARGPWRFSMKSGNFITQLIAGSRLTAPWGITLAPAGFGRFINHPLVGNFSFLRKEINAFDPTTGKLRGTIRINVGKGNKPGGLWALDFGVGGSNGDPNTLYFTDGINGEADGLFGAIFANGNRS